MECSLCKEIKQPSKDAKIPCHSCDSCRRLICLECSELSSSEIRCLPLQRRLLMFHCKSCRNNDYVKLLQSKIEDKEALINDKIEIIKLLQEKLHSYENEMMNKHTYANVLTTNDNHKLISKPINVPDLIIKPKIKQQSKITKQDIDNKIKLSELKIGVKKCIATKTGSVVIKCQSKTELEILENVVRDKLQDEYDIERSKLRKPRIKIPNFDQEMTLEEIEKSIINQNDLSDDLKITYIKKGHTSKNIVFGECSAEIFKKLTGTNKVYIGWERYAIYEDLNIPRCHNCHGFYHKKENCPTDHVICPKCSENHHENECTKAITCCVNCVKSNQIYKMNYNVSHKATDRECPSLEHQDLSLIYEEHKGNYLNPAEYASLFNNMPNKVLNIMHCNIRSIRKNFNEFLAMYETYALYSCDIFILSECFRLESTENLHIPGYDTKYNGADFNKNDGTVILIKSNLNYNVKNIKLAVSGVTLSILELACNGLSYRIIGLYRPCPSNLTAFIEEIDDFL
ncbi:hypothetical protein JTB14_032505 [Gonioctena quinquepunctata]|nr:hypothetical protein JTB14_032505 [Gonioctena quinquepunctata]